jgi:hypothetical protein
MEWDGHVTEWSPTLRCRPGARLGAGAPKRARGVRSHHPNPQFEGAPGPRFDGDKPVAWECDRAALSSSLTLPPGAKTEPLRLGQAIALPIIIVPLGPSPIPG